MAEWVTTKRNELQFQVGQIGVLSIEIRYEIIRGATIADFKRGEALGYEIYWLSPEYVHGEGLAILHDNIYPIGAIGLEEAKKAAIEWAKQLLHEAWGSLPIRGEIP
jgi:hypothetical protein